ncbi:MAG TPA: nuclear transport factor 2 family protein [Pseudolysinimonas sp.]|jgi:ketosteroid isomerase-like protein|nr:nuclear transport factor 2 family protein [Pseudolysinimonas sp.]
MRVDIVPIPQSPAQSVVDRFFHALAGESPLADIFHEEATWTVWGSSPLAGTHRGRDAVLNGFHAEAGRLFDPEADGVLTVHRYIGVDDVVAAEFEYRTTTALNRAYHNHYVEVFEVRGDHVLRVREYMDTDHFRKVCYP